MGSIKYKLCRLLQRSPHRENFLLSYSAIVSFYIFLRNLIESNQVSFLCAKTWSRIHVLRLMTYPGIARYTKFSQHPLHWCNARRCRSCVLQSDVQHLLLFPYRGNHLCTALCIRNTLIKNTALRRTRLSTSSPPLVGCQTWIRTKILWFRVIGPTVRRSGNIETIR